MSNANRMTDKSDLIFILTGFRIIVKNN